MSSWIEAALVAHQSTGGENNGPQSDEQPDNGMAPLPDGWHMAVAPDGTGVTDQFRVNDVRSSTQTDPAVEALDNGGFVIAWADHGGADGHGAHTLDETIYFSSIEPMTKLWVRLFETLE